ncbi:MAG: M23 family metallopeptidase [Clostridiales bacterium]|jgi:murein DD-endopeptidase MepM/ murein hydrolase activator NlpD|nr:M23 family metallopeptidase [Clostridiales bacterium]
MDNNKTFLKIKGFFKKNYYYVIMAVCVVAIGSMITIAALQAGAKTPPPPINDPPTSGDPGGDPDTDTGATPVVFVLPIESASGTGLVYDDDELQYYATLKQWQAHYGVDYLAPAGTDVRAVSAGVVESITTNEMWGTTITILHDGGVRSIYKCLGNNVNVLKNQKVTAGQKIGVVGDTGYLEESDGTHLHFEMTVNNEHVDPSAYFEENK